MNTNYRKIDFIKTFGDMPKSSGRHNVCKCHTSFLTVKIEAADGSRYIAHTNLDHMIIRAILNENMRFFGGGYIASYSGEYHKNPFNKVRKFHCVEGKFSFHRITEYKVDISISIETMSRHLDVYRSVENKSMYGSDRPISVYDQVESIRSRRSGKRTYIAINMFGSKANTTRAKGRSKLLRRWTNNWMPIVRPMVEQLYEDVVESDGAERLKQFFTSNDCTKLREIWCASARETINKSYLETNELMVIPNESLNPEHYPLAFPIKLRFPAIEYADIHYTTHSIDKQHIREWFLQELFKRLHDADVNNLVRSDDNALVLNTYKLNGFDELTSADVQAVPDHKYIIDFDYGDSFNATLYKLLSQYRGVLK